MDETGDVQGVRNPIEAIPSEAIVGGKWLEMAPGFRSALVDVSPAIAEALLQFNDPLQRRCTESDVAPLARDMSTPGRYKLTHQGWLLNLTQLLDGQTRARAVVASGATTRVLISQIDDAKVTDPIDVQRRRALAFLLGTTKKRASCGMVLTHFMRGHPSLSGPSPTHAEIGETLSRVETNMTEFLTQVPDGEKLLATVLAVCLFVWPLDREGIARFANGVLSGQIEPNASSGGLSIGDPALAFNKYRLSGNARGSKAAEAALSCVRAIVEGEELNRVSIKRGSGLSTSFVKLCVKLRSAGIEYAPTASVVGWYAEKKGKKKKVAADDSQLSMPGGASQ